MWGPAMTERAYTPPQLAKRWAVSPDRIRAMIRSGRLAAFNLADPGERPQFRIGADAVEAFERGQEVQTPVRRQARRRLPPVEEIIK